MTDRTYSAWLVDLDGTLYKPTPVKWAMAVELILFGWRDLRSIQTFRREHEALREDGGAFEPSPFAEQLRRAAAKLDGDESRLAHIIGEWMQERPCKWISKFKNRPLIAELRAFRAGGGQLALVSDYPGAKKLAALGMSDDFDVVVCNGEPGGPAQLKPNPEGYLLAAERLGCAPNTCLVLGDRDDADGRAARTAGMGFRKI
jgi:HAD superfamily hydrolase (TIGR01549 family)